jgi:DNA-binding MarR family transcriptional regulator
MPAAAKTRLRRAPPALALSALLSQVLVAFTIEFDNEFEHRTPHRTTERNSGKHAAAKPEAAHAPWLVSLAMWALFLRFVPERGISVRELLHATDLDKQALRQWLVRLTAWWGYLTVAPDLAASPVMPPPGDWIVRPTPGGFKAQQVWRRLFGVIEKRWRERFDDEPIDKLRDSLAAIVAELDLNLPEYLPILGYGLRADCSRFLVAPSARVNASTLNLPALLAKVLLAFTIDYERESELSLALYANVLRVLDDEGVRVRDLPSLSGVSNEAIKMGLGFLSKDAYVAIETENPSSRTKLIRLTAKGVLAQDAYSKLLTAVEGRWRTRFGEEKIHRLREALERLVGNGPAERSPLFQGLEPYADGWRASLPKPATLPHHPMVLHRGGYPDGS